MDGQMYDRRMDNQCDTIIPHHYCVVVYKKPITIVADDILIFLFILVFIENKSCHFM